MEMIEIDPKLFVTCRLCLDNMGVYQIVPSVQQQIKFCFDIEVDPFDRLPQLICKNCESILSKYWEIKHNYVKKQKTLRENLKVKTVTSIGAPKPESEPEQEAVSSTQQFISDDKDKTKSNEIIICDASSMKSTDTETSAIIKKRSKKPNKRKKKPLPDSWETEYDKWFICRLCNKVCKTRCGVRKHINTHPSLLHQYRTYIDKSCSLTLQKLDNKPNLCNSERIVVHDMDKFIGSNSEFYYTLFKQKRMLEYGNDEENSLIDTMSVLNTDKSPESSDSEPVYKTKKKRLRLISRSSNETVVLDNNLKNESYNFDTKTTSKVNMVMDDSECINLDDSSDSASCKGASHTNNNISKNFLTSNQMDRKIIQNIISICYKKYLKKFEHNVSDAAAKSTKKFDSSLRHKVLSFGRKIINNSEINCTGILRYLENYNLEVVWIPRLTHSSKKSEHVQIMTKLKNCEENDGGWTVLQDLGNSVGSNTFNLSEINYVENQTFGQNSDPQPSADKLLRNEDKEKRNDLVLSKPETLCPTNSNADKDLLLKKLLNENPVQNPKQLRKKPNSLQMQSAGVLTKTKDKEKPTEEPLLSVSTNETVAEMSESALHMPIITSTMSLAPVTTAEDNARDNISDEHVAVSENTTKSHVDPNALNRDDKSGSVSESQVPATNAPQWIKVKPVTELMSDRALNTMNQQSVQESSTPMNQSMSNVPYQNSSNIIFMANLAVPQVVKVVNASQLQKPVEMLSMENNIMPARQSPLDREFVVMHTVDLPNTKTDSPFRYFKMLLEIHKIILLDVKEKMSVDFHSIIKFKMECQQETNVPVVLYLSLHCSISPNSAPRVCIKVRDMHHKDIDLTTLSINWQWEILKSFGGYVVERMLQNAQKISKIVFDCTKIFVCLLKSITFQKLS